MKEGKVHENVHQTAQVSAATDWLHGMLATCKFRVGCCVKQAAQTNPFKPRFLSAALVVGSYAGEAVLVRLASLLCLAVVPQVVAEKTKEYGTKGWSILRSAYANVATSLEQTAAANGYKVDLGKS